MTGPPTTSPARRGYQLGPGLLALASGLWSEGTLSAAVTRAMAAIRDETGLTIELSLVSGRHRTVVCEAQSTRPLRYANGVGSSAPLHAGAAGRALLAFCEAPTREAVLAGQLERLTPATITSPAELRESLRAVREAGYAHSDGERAPGVRSVAVPIIDRGAGVAVGVLAAVGPREAFPAAADQLAARLATEVQTTVSAAMSGFV